MNNKRKAVLISSGQLLSEIVGKPIDQKAYNIYIDKLIKTDVRIIVCIIIFLISLLYIYNGLNNDEMLLKYCYLFPHLFLFIKFLLKT